MSAPQDPLDENEMLAAEYALGVLSAADRARAQNMAKQSPAFAARVTAWETRLSPLADDIDPVPAPNLMPQIEARLFGRAPKKSFSAKWLTMPKGWLGGLVGTTVMAVLSVLVLAFMLQFGAPTPVQTATLMAKDSAVEYAARLEGAQITLTRLRGPAPAADRSYELWVIDGNAAPLSLGLIDAALTLPAPNAAAGYVLAITDEPLGGGPGGLPTGAVIALGNFSQY
jgi:anti-sigma-K factor RskA